MSVEQSVYSTLSSITPSRVFPVAIPADTVRPAISYMVAGVVPSNSMDCVGGVEVSTVQVDVLGDTYGQTVEIGNQVVAAMAATGANLTILTDMDDLAPSIYRRVMRFDCRY
jgi:hypothetical protein